MILLDRDLRVRLINPMFEQRWGVQQEAVKGKHLDDLVPHVHAQDIKEQYRGILEQGRVYRRQEAGVDGEGYDLVIRAPIRDIDGDPGGIIIIRLDITDQKQTEVALEASESRLSTLASSDAVALGFGARKRSTRWRAAMPPSCQRHPDSDSGTESPSSAVASSSC